MISALSLTDFLHNSALLTSRPGLINLNMHQLRRPSWGLAIEPKHSRTPITHPPMPQMGWMNLIQVPVYKTSQNPSRAHLSNSALSVYFATWYLGASETLLSAPTILAEGLTAGII